VASPIAATTTSSGQPNSNGAFGDGSFGAGERGHYTSVAASSASSDATTAAALGANSSGPVATAAAPGTTPTPDGNGTVAGTITDQVTDHLLRLVSNGSREMTMRLHPPELGDLTVRVAVSGRDVSAWFASPQPQVQNAINDALGQLQTNLGSAGYNLTGAWVGADGSSARQRGSELPAPPTPTSPASSSSALPAAVAAVSRPPASGLNIYV
jgi:flagellar hook-length control protein FliK